MALTGPSPAQLERRYAAYVLHFLNGRNMAESETSTRPFQLARHVRACRVGDQVILLDLSQDKYVGVGGAQLAGLSRTILGWPDDPAKAGEEMSSSTTEQLVSRLLHQGMLANADEFRDRTPPLATASRSFQSQSFEIAWNRRWRPLLSLCLSARAASRWLSRYNLGEIAERVMRLRERHQASQERSTEALQLAVSTYLRLRPFVLTSQDRCLYDSLSLVHFLAKRRLHATWVIGVRTRPFGAHSWVQCGGMVLNDLHERVLGFTPIFMV